jgi:hypothetical protein
MSMSPQLVHPGFSRDSRRRFALTFASIASLAAAACTGGSIGDGSNPSAGGPSQGNSPGGGAMPGTNGNNGSSGGSSAPTPAVPSATGTACKDVQPGQSPLRRLTRAEYDNTVRDLLGEASGPAHDFPDEERSFGFDNNATTRSVSDLLADRYVGAAAKLADVAVAKLPTLLACDPVKSGEPACLTMFLDTFARRAWRRPLEADERANLEQTFADGKTTTFAEGIGAVVQVLLLSPQFLYRVERGTPVPGASHLALTGYEMASRLSYMLWGTMPDADLMTAAESGALGTREAVRAQAERMLKDPRAAALVGRFSDEWLRLDELSDLDKDIDIFPAFTADVRDPLRQETQKLVDKVVWHGDGKFSALLTSPTTFVNGPLATYYGITGVTGDAYKEVPLDPKQRLGFLGHAGILSVLGVPADGLTSLVFRGLFVRERLLCQPLGDPPPNAQSENPPFTPTTTAREWSVARQAKANCGACHRMMDPIGFGLENFDGIGQWRTSDHGQPVDAQGELSGTDIDGSFSGAPELAQRLARSPMVSDCMATQWFRFGYGREEAKEDACTLGTLRTAFATSGGNIRDLLIALTQTDAFMFRSPASAQTTGAQP